MIYCVTQSPDKYVEHLPTGQVCGLYTQYGHRPELFNLMTRTVTASFMYEPGFEGYPVGKRIQSLYGDDCLVATLDQDVEGVSMKTLLNTTCPETMFNMFLDKKPEHLEVVKFYAGWDGLIAAMRVRVLQFKKYYRGIINTNKNLVYARFRSDLSEQEDKFLTESVKILRKAFEEKMLK